MTGNHWPLGGSSFPATRVSLLERIGSAEPEVRHAAFGTLTEGYWKPIYTYLRIKWRLPEEDAKDTTQAFLATAFEKEYFKDFDPAKARFRTFLRTCLDRFALKQERAATALKRGGGVAIVGLDFATAEGEIRSHDPPDPVDVDAFFRQESIRALFSQSVADVQEACVRGGKDVHFRLFERYDLGPEHESSYAALAQEFELSVSQVTNYLAAVRRMFRTAVLQRLREISGTDEEYRADARELLGVEVE